ncbi:MAG: hypothetical protein QOD26_2100 [Betaproteobacteria bacterium]|jgi:hypothetical protein|nr:hypothetical protein [Betaproteobacteria bacterium]
MWKPQGVLAAAMLALSGCAAIQGQMAGDSENILAQAGFTRQPQSAAQGATRADGKPLPARQLTTVSDNGNTAYEFYDPKFCQCVYVGGEAELAKLKELRSARVAEHAQNLRMWSVPANGADPSTWGPWQPAGLDPR